MVGSGRAEDEPDADHRHELNGGTLVPGFCDAHVHLPTTGLYAAGADFRGERSTSKIVATFADIARDRSALLFGGNFEDPLDEPLTRLDLDRAVGDRPAMLARADMHSCIVSSSLLSRLDLAGLEGVDVDDEGSPTGYLRERAAATAWTWFDGSLTAEQQERAVMAAAEIALAKGVTAVHEMFVVEWRGWPSLEVFRAAVEKTPLDVTIYAGTSDVDRIVDLGFDRIGGDFFLDGAFGSHTAWLSEAYSSAPPEGSPVAGISYRDDDELLEFFGSAQEAGLQVGVHAIGDAAIEQAIATWEKVASKVGADPVRGLGHRIEHFEFATDDHIARASGLGLRASVQPAFDRFWGGPDGLYARRMGWERARWMNRFVSMRAAPILVGAGSDSTVTPLDPFLQMAALRDHHLPDERMAPADALHLHTAAAHDLAGAVGGRGHLAAGAHADLTILDRDPVSVDVDDLLATKVSATWIGDVPVWPEPVEVAG